MPNNAEVSYIRANFLITKRNWNVRKWSFVNPSSVSCVRPMDGWWKELFALAICIIAGDDLLTVDNDEDDVSIMRSRLIIMLLRSLLG